MTAFEKAQEAVKTLTERPTNEELLELYAWYKQATEGDNDTSKPGMFDVKGKFKWEAWNNKRGTGTEQAKKEYAALVKELLKKYAHS